MKELDKIYTALDADELEKGDVVQVADSKADFYITNTIKRIQKLVAINPDDVSFRFVVEDADGNPNGFLMAKFICPASLAKYYFAFHNGKKLQYFDPVAKKLFRVESEPVWDEEAINQDLIQNGGFFHIEK